jgi:hypothetical protein
MQNALSYSYPYKSEERRLLGCYAVWRLLVPAFVGIY